MFRYINVIIAIIAIVTIVSMSVSAKNLVSSGLLNVVIFAVLFSSVVIFGLQSTNLEQLQRIKKYWAIVSSVVFVLLFVHIVYNNVPALLLDASVLGSMAFVGWLILDRYERIMFAIQQEFTSEVLSRYRTNCPSFFTENNGQCVNDKHIMSKNGKLLDSIEPLYVTSKLTTSVMDNCQKRDMAYPWAFYNYVCENVTVKKDE